MRIAQVAPLIEAVPPKFYGGTERVVSWLTEELVAMGHDVTLFASGDSKTNAKLIPCCPQALRLDSGCKTAAPHHILMLERVIKMADQFDVIHVHIDYIHYPWARRCHVPVVTTQHGRQDINDLIPIQREFMDLPLVSISDAQRKPMPWANWARTIPHGLPLHLLKPSYKPGRYLAFLGRFSPEKRFDRAVELARRLNLPLMAAAKADQSERPYFQQVIKPLLDDPLVEWVGEISESEKSDFLGNALALVLPIDWPEPFGLVMIEAMACGTPTIAWRQGSVAEVIENGVTGFIVENMDQAEQALSQISDFDRTLCRQRFEQRFSATRMARDYLSLFNALIQKRKPDLRPVIGGE